MRGAIGVEIALAFAAVVAAVILAVSISHRLSQRTRTDRFVSEVRALSAALEAYHQMNGKWPPNALEKETPEGLATFLASTQWPETTAIGGRYVWTPPTGREPGTLGVTDFDPSVPLLVSRGELRAIDAIMDDGDLASGRLRTGFNGWPIYLLGP